MTTHHPDYYLGFQSLEKETDEVVLPVEGQIPQWLSGSLIRNGPAIFQVGEKQLNHWFDGFSALHRFAFVNQQVKYTSRFLRSDAYTLASQTGKICKAEFATNPEQTFWERMTSILSPPLTDNTNVNVVCFGTNYVAMTETADLIKFDPITLNTIGKFKFNDPLKLTLMTAHPHFDYSKNTLINLGISLGPKSHYHFYSCIDRTNARKTIASIPVNNPGYIHSFAMTEQYIVLLEFPLTVNPIELIMSGKPFIQNYWWQPDRSTRIFVVDKDTGIIAYQSETAPFFAFHHINAFEKSDKIFVDVLAYPDNSIVQDLYLDSLAQMNAKVSQARLLRLEIDLATKSVRQDQLLSDGFELPRIHYKQHNSFAYRYCYAVGSSSDASFLDRLTKIDLAKLETVTWYSESCYPGEPVFVPRPGSNSEDDGILLSVVLDIKSTKSFLLILNAASMQQIAKAPMPNFMPFGFHGQFTHV